VEIHWASRHTLHVLPNLRLDIADRFGRRGHLMHLLHAVVDVLEDLAHPVLKLQLHQRFADLAFDGFARLPGYRAR
jgi:hypothetical protein